MYISQTPLLKLPLVLAKTRSQLRGECWKAEANSKIAIFSRGQWAIKEIASGIIRQKRKERGKIYIPEYFCEISLTTLRMSAFDIHFYRITPDFEPDIDHLNEISQRYGVPDVLLLVHYFGFPSKIHDSIKWCQQNDVILVEDAAHSFTPIPGIGDNENPTIYTPWKFLNIPEGALLVLPGKLMFLSEGFNNAVRPSAYPLSWISKQVLSLSIQHLKIPAHKLRRIRIKGHDESEQPIDPKNLGCSVFSFNLLSQYGQYIDKIRSIRERNYKRLDEIFLKTDISMYRIFKKIPALFAPYIYPLRVPADVNIDIMTAMNKRGIPAAPWSDLSPEVKDSQEYPLSNALRREVITLPIHQDLTLAHIDWMAGEVIKSFKVS